MLRLACQQTRMEDEAIFYFGILLIFFQLKFLFGQPHVCTLLPLWQKEIFNLLL
jgi:hypothetical protein